MNYFSFYFVALRRVGYTPFNSSPADMILGHLLLLVLTLYSSLLLAAEYDGTRIANRTIERVRRDSSTLRRMLTRFHLYRPFNCERIPCLPHTLMRTSKIGAFQMLLALYLLQRLLAGGGTLVPTRMWYVAGCLCPLPGNPLTSRLRRTPTNTFD